MTDLSITPANVVKGANARIDRNGYAGETITAGMAVCKNSSGFWVKSDSNHATALLRVATGLALNGASQYQPLDVQTDGSLAIGATLTPSIAYYLSDTAGGICPVADVGSGEYSQVIGIASSASVLKLGLLASGAAS